MHRKNNRGFTLIELLVVIAIIGILSSVVLASLNTARQKARDTARIADVKQIQLALEFFFDTCGSYPALATEGDPLLSTSSVAGCASTMADFIPTIPVPPTGITLVEYEYWSGSPVDYCLGVEFEDANAIPGNDTNCDANGATVAVPDYTAAGFYSTSP